MGEDFKTAEYLKKLNKSLGTNYPETEKGVREWLDKHDRYQTIGGEKRYQRRKKRKEQAKQLLKQKGK